MEKYSVLMSLYKKEKPEYFKLAIESMLKQTEKPDEIVLVEDGPLTEELYEVVTLYKDKLKIIVNEENMGLGIALDIGLKQCTNELVARMDTDDISELNRCEKQLLFMQAHPEISVVGGQIEEFIGSPKNAVGKRIVPVDDMSIKVYMKKRCAFNHMSVMFRKSDIMEAGSYKEWFYNEDYYLWIRMMLKEKNLPIWIRF